MVGVLVTAFIICLVRTEASRIVGGGEVAPNSIPWQVSIQDVSWNNWHICGGTVLSETYVLTGALCCQGQAIDNMKVVGGVHDLFTEEGTEQGSTVQHILIHPDFDPTSLINDICLLRLSSPFIINKVLLPVLLPITNYTWPQGSMARVSGWGKQGEDGVSPATLQAADISIVDWEACRQIYGEEAVQEGMLCAGGDGKDACQGDGGGPLTCGAESRTLCGIVSWGLGCGLVGYPGIYTDVARYTEWINSNMV